MQLMGVHEAVFSYVKPPSDLTCSFSYFFNRSVENKLDQVRDVARVKTKKSKSIPSSPWCPAHQPCFDLWKEISW